MMSGSAAASQISQHPSRTSTVPALDAQAAELKAERLWGMADARKPVPMERKNGMPEVSQFGDRSWAASLSLMAPLVCLARSVSVSVSRSVSRSVSAPVSLFVFVFVFVSSSTST